MAHKACHDVGIWVNQNIQQPVEQCIDHDCIWWCLCCNKWLCFIVWVIVQIVTWVVQTLCEIVADIVELIAGIVKGIYDIFAGIFTWDGSRALGGLAEIGIGFVVLIGDLIPIVTGGTLVGGIRDERDRWRLRNFAQGLLEDRYRDSDPAGLAQMLDALGINSGGFGLRLNVRALRTFVRSDFSSQPDGTPDLILWLRNNSLPVSLKTLAGIDPPYWFGSRSFPELIGDAGDISDVDLDHYVEQNGRGDDVKQFTIFCMSNRDMQQRLDTATQHATELGLILQFTVEDVPLHEASQVIINRDRFPEVLKTDPFLRHDRTDLTQATAELCAPIVIGSFGFTDSSGSGILSGFGVSAHFADSTCLETMAKGTNSFVSEGITGAAFRNARPDQVFKYTAIHELGHSFGLCHVDGLLRIMYTYADSEDKSLSSSSSWWQYWTTGTEAGFTLDEGKKVWEYIVHNFPADCLKV
jgi:hypothetical protein